MQHNANHQRHPELGSPVVTYVPGSILFHERMILAAGWMLKRVQHDEYEWEFLID
jgi:hypothetical protein